MNRLRLRQALPILLAIGLLWYVLKDVPVTTLADQFRRANYGWLAVVGLIVVGYLVSRAGRWQLTLQAIGYYPSLFHALIALLAGTLASMIVPGAGELTRCGTLQRTDDVPVAKGIGSVVAERVIDLLMLAVLIGLTFLLEFRRVGTFLTALFAPVLTRLDPKGQFGLLMLAGIVIAGALTGFIYWLFRHTAFRQRPFIRSVIRIGRDVGKGFMSIGQLKRPWLFVGLTLLSYLLSFLTIYVLFLASSSTVHLPPTAALTILTVSSLGGLAVPTQGGLGTYHFLVSRVLMLYGMAETESVVVATFLHAVGFGLNLVFSSLSFLVVPALINAKRTESTTGVVK